MNTTRIGLISIGALAGTISLVGIAGAFPDLEQLGDISSPTGVTGDGDIIRDYIWCGAPVTDTAALACLVAGADSLADLGITNTTGGNLVIVGGSGTVGTTIAATDPSVTCAGDTVTVTVTDSAGTATATVLTEGAGADWVATSSKTTTATALAAAIDAISGVSAVGSGTEVQMTRDHGTVSMAIATSDASCDTVANGTIGKVYVMSPMTMWATLKLLDDVPLTLGTGDDVQIEYDTAQTQDSLWLGVGTDSRGFIIAENADYGYDFAHAQQTNPTLWIQSATQSATEWLSAAHNQTDAAISAGKGGFVFQGVGSTSTEDLKWRYGDTSNQVDVSSSSSVDDIDFGTIDLNADEGTFDGDLYLMGGGTLQSENLGTAANTGSVTFASGNNTNAGDYKSGDVAIKSGISTTLGDTGAVAVYSGNAADTSGTVQVYSGTSANTAEQTGSVAVYSGAQTHATGGVSGDVSVYSGAAAGTAASGGVSVYSGAQTNAGNYATGPVLLATGNTTTDGDTGSITLRTGVAGAGSADAGSIYFQTHGTNTRLTIAGSDGKATFADDADVTDNLTAGDIAIDEAAGVLDFTGGTSGEIEVSTGDLILDVASDSIMTEANKDNLFFDIPVSGADATAHAINLRIDGNPFYALTATGDGAGGVGVSTTSIGVTAKADLVHVGDANALVDITDAHWSVTEAGIITGEHLASTDDGDIVDNMTVGDLVVDETAGVIDFSGATSATISTSGTNIPITLLANGSGYVTATSTEIYQGDGTYAWNHTPGIGTENALEVDGMAYCDAGATVAGAALDVQGQMITEGDGTYSWDHTPTGIATEGSIEADGVIYGDAGLVGALTGAVDLNGGTLTWDADADTYVNTATDDTLLWYFNGAKDFTIAANSFTAHAGGSIYYEDDVQTFWKTDSGTGAYVEWDTAPATDIFTIHAPASGIKFETAGAATTEDAILICNSDVCTLSTDTGVTTFDVSTMALFGTGGDFGDADIDNVQDIALDSISPDGTNISATVGAGALYVGDGTYSFGNSPQFAVESIAEIDGLLYADGYVVTQLVRGASATTDAAALSTNVFAGNAYARATGGNQAAPNLNLKAGIGTRQITIDDYTQCGTDTVTLTTNGSATVCTEAGGGCTWSAATSNEATATSLAAAIEALANVSAAAVGAVVYITPDDANVFALDLAESDGNCTSLTQGTDGSIVMHMGNAQYTFSDSSIATAGADIGTSAAPFHSVYFNTARVGTDSFTADANYALHVSTSTAGGGIRVTQTDAGGAGPNITLHHDSSSPVDSDVVGQINFNGEDSTSADTTYAHIYAELQDHNNTSEEAIIRYKVLENAVDVEYMRNDGSDGVQKTVFSRGIDLSELTITNAGDIQADSLTCDADANVKIATSAADINYTVDATGTEYDMNATSFDAEGAKGQLTSLLLPKTVELSCDGNATLSTAADFIPDGAFLLGITTRVTSAGLTGPASMDIGDGSDADLYANDTGVADNDVTDNTDITAQWANPQMAQSAVVLTWNGGNCTVGTVRVSAHFLTITAPTAD